MTPPTLPAQRLGEEGEEKKAVPANYVTCGNVRGWGEKERKARPRFIYLW